MQGPYLKTSEVGQRYGGVSARTIHRWQETIKLIKFKNLYLNYFAIKINMYTIMYTANKSPLMRAFAFR